MLYWIWFCSLTVAAFTIAYFTIKWEVGEPVPVFIQIFSLVMTWSIHGGKLWTYLSDSIPEPDTFIHSFTVFFVTALPAVFWVAFPVVFWAFVVDSLEHKNTDRPEGDVHANAKSS